MNCCRCGKRAIWRLWEIGAPAVAMFGGAYCEGCLDREVEYAYAPWYATPILPDDGSEAVK